VTIAIRPSLWGRTARLIKVIWVRREAKNICKKGWTGGISSVGVATNHAAVLKSRRHPWVTGSSVPPSDSR
jgi:hypothetical protein